MLREKLVSEVIPQIISKLRPEVQSTVAELDKAMLSELEKEINESINIEIEAMQQAKARMDVATQENNAYINDIDEALAMHREPSWDIEEVNRRISTYY